MAEASDKFSISPSGQENDDALEPKSNSSNCTSINSKSPTQKRRNRRKVGRSMTSTKQNSQTHERSKETSSSMSDFHSSTSTVAISTEKDANSYQKVHEHEKSLSLKSECLSKETLLVEGMHSNLPDTITDDDLKKHFLSYRSDIVSVYVQRDQQIPHSRVCGVIRFGTIQAASNAQKKFNATHLLGKFQIRVRYMQPSESVDLNSASGKSAHVIESFSKKDSKSKASFPRKHSYGTLQSVSNQSSTTQVCTSQKNEGASNSAKSSPSNTDDPAQVLTKSPDMRPTDETSCSIFIENLSPLIDEGELKALIQTYGVTVLSLSIHSNPADPHETCIANVTLSNQSQAAYVVSELNEKELYKLKPQACIRLGKNTSEAPLVITKQRKISSRLFKFICYHKHEQVEQFKLNGGVFEYQESDGCAKISCQDERLVTRFMQSVVNKCTEKRLKLRQSAWHQLTVNEDEQTTSLLDEVMSSFCAELEPYVLIISQKDQKTILFVGANEGVERAHTWLLVHLYETLKVDREKMKALTTIFPNLDSQLSEKHNVEILNYSQESTIIEIKGKGKNMQLVHEEIEKLISEFSTTEIQFEHSRLLLESARKRIKECEYMVCIEEPAIASKRRTETLCVKVISFNPKHLDRSVHILKGKLTYKSLKIPRPSDIPVVSSKLKIAQRVVSSEHVVLIRPIYKNHTCTSLLISGFVKNDVVAAHSQLLEKIPTFTAAIQQKDSSHTKINKPPMLALKENPVSSFKIKSPCVADLPTTEDSLASSLPVATLRCKKVNSNSTQCTSCTLWVEAHYMPFILSPNFVEISSKIEKDHGVKILHTNTHSVNSIVKQVVFKTNSNHLIAVQLCYCNLFYEDVDAIVNCTPKLPEEMQNMGGTALKLQLDRYIASHPQEMDTKACVILDSGELPCKSIIHAFPYLTIHENQTAEEKPHVICEVLKCALEHDLQSISFPFTSDDVLSTERLMHDIQVFFIQHPDACVHLLRIVCSSDQLLTAFGRIDEFNCKADIIDLPKSVSMIKQPTIPQWYWQGDDGIFTAYAKVINEMLCVAYNTCPTSECKFQVGSHRYIVKFQRMVQINESTNFVRKIKVDCDSRNGHTGMKHESSAVNVNVKWSYYSEDQKPSTYSASDSNNIERVYLNSSISPTIVHESKRFSLDFKAMTKQCFQKPVQDKALFLERKVMVCQCSQHSPKWYYMGNAQQYVPYSKQDTVSIEKMYQSRTATTISINTKTYSFDFDHMKQINTATRYKRSIRRVIKVDSSSTKIIPIHHICGGIVVALKGKSQNLEKAKADLQTKLESMLCTHSLPLPSSVSKSSQALTRISNVASTHNLSCTFLQESDCDAATNVESRVKLSGKDSLIQVALKSIMEEITLIATEGKGNTESAASHEIPSEWERQTQNTMLFELPKTSNEYVRIERNFLSTMSDAAIVRIERIQNNWLWERYVLTRKRLCKKNNGRVNEKQLFHGSRSRAQMIYDSEEGFDMRFSSKGMWGEANYFAEKASYSNSYAYERDDGTREILLAKVLTGDSCNCPSDRTLRMPPVKEGQICFEQERYDTVNGETNGSRVYMTYSNDKAYPAYLIVYKPHFINCYSTSTHSSNTSAAQTLTPGLTWNYTPASSSVRNSGTQGARVTSSTASPSATHSIHANYQQRPHRPQSANRSTAHQTTTRQSSQPSSNQSTCTVQ